MSIKKTISSSIIFLSVVGYAQVVTNMGSEYGTKGIITTTTENAVEEQDYTSDEIIFQWNDTYKDFKSFDGAKKIDKEVLKQTGNVHPLQGKWAGFSLPVILDENGIDLFYLTEDGINIYMAMDEPIFLQDIDADIVKWVRYYAYHKRKNTQMMFRRYAKWEEHIKNYFSSQGVPPEIAELCLIESACTYQAKSPVGALGMWQIMPDTGRAYGLKIDAYTDERLDPVKATIAAAKILNRNHERIGDWTLAIAAYNCGPGRFIKKETKGIPWSQIKNRLPKETQQYIPSLIAIHYTWIYRKQLGFN